MIFEFKKVNSTVKPPVVDTLSSKTGVYYRKNIEKKTGEDNASYYEYDEILLPNEYKLGGIEDKEIYAAKLDEIIKNNNNNIYLKRIEEIKQELSAIDLKSIRPARAGETEKLDELENEAIKLRAELWQLEELIV